jgi:heme exporter protein D
VILLSLLPLLLLALLTMGVAYFAWEPAVSAVRMWLDERSMWATAVQWLTFLGAGGFKSVIAPLIVLAVAVPILVMICLLIVSVFMTPAIVRLVAARRFDALARLRGSSLALQAAWGMGHALVAVIVFAITLPLWLVPMVALLLPPLIWGWLTYRVLAFDTLADHASPAERKALFKSHRLPLLVMGVISGYLGTVPGVLGLSSVFTIALAPIFVPLALWLYTLVFAFSSAWFAHYLLSALEGVRNAQADARKAEDAAKNAAALEPPPPAAPPLLPPNLNP